MYQINHWLATTAIETKDAPHGYFIGDRWFALLDVRDLKDDGTNKLIDYAKYIFAGDHMINDVMGYGLIIGCDAGISRSNAIALGVLTLEMNFYDAWELIKEKVPICDVDPSHIVKLKMLFGVTLP